MGFKVLSAVFFFVFLSANLSQAQLINHNRRAKYNKAFKNKKVNAVPAVEAHVLTEVQKYIYSGLTITKRSEKLYDYNFDNVFQKAEIQDYLSAVVDAVQLRGRYSAETEVLSYFDMDNNGRIQEDEAARIKNAINR